MKTGSEDCDHVETEDVLPPAGVLGVHLSEGEQQVEVRYDPKKLSAEEAGEYARRLAADPTRFQRCLFHLQGRACEACALKLENKVEKLEGVQRASATFVGNLMSVHFDEQVISSESLLNKVREKGARVQPLDQAENEDQRLEAIFTALTLVFMLLGHFATPTAWFSFPLAFFFGGWFGLQAAWQSLKEATVDVDLLMILAALGAAYIGAPLEGAVLLFLFSLSNVLQGYAIDQTRRAIHSLMKLRPEQALVKRGQETLLVKVEELVLGDRVIVRPGESVPLDGAIVEGETSLDESSLTGESLPVRKTVKDQVFAGTINQTGSLEIEVTRLAKDSTIAKLMQMVEEAQSEKAETQRWLDRAEQYYAVGVILFTLSLILLPWLVLKQPFASSFYKAITIMVVASPCALILSTPASILSGIGGAARRGILFKGGVHLERAAAIDAIAFDKTGTLTEGKPRVTDLVTVSGSFALPSDRPDSKAEELLRLAAAVERRSEHPLAQAVVTESDRLGLEALQTTSFLSVSGKGATAELDGQSLAVGSPRFFREQGFAGLDLLEKAVEQLAEAGKTVILVARQNEVLGAVGVADTLRPDARDTLERLRAMGIARLVMVTGDNERVAQAIAKQAGIEEVRAELLPQDKVKVLEELKAEHRVAMVGDGINDAPALATADLGIAMGVAGTDVAMETADIVFMGEQLKHLPTAFAISRKARSIMIQNLSFALGVIVVLVVAALWKELPLTLGVLGHEGSTVLVCLNGLRLLFYRPQ